MKTLLPTLLLVLAAVGTVTAAPRKVRPLSFPQDESKAPRVDTTLEQDSSTQKDQEAAAAIRAETEGPRLTERTEGETFTQYRERLENARERLKNDKVRSEELKDAQQEALYEAEYQLRKETFYDTQTPMYGQGAGNWGIKPEKPIPVRRVIQELETQSKDEPTTQEASSDTNSVQVEEPNTDQQREEGEE